MLVAWQRAYVIAEADGSLIWVVDSFQEAAHPSQLEQGGACQPSVPACAHTLLKDSAKH